MNTSPALLLIFLLLSACHGEEQIDSNASSIAATMKGQKVETLIESSCPDPTDIEPCVCLHDDGLIMDCSAIQDEQQLWQVFSADFPTTAFYKFFIYWNDGLKVLENGVFHNVSFQVIDIAVSNLEIIENEALNSSLSTLTRIDIETGHLTTFPFERLPEFTSLQDLDLYLNHIPSIPPLSSSTLQNLVLMSNVDLPLPPDVFKGLTAIRYINFAICGLTEITPGTFNDLPELRFLDLFNNNLTYIPSLTFDLASSLNDSGYIDLWGNNIEVVEVDAFRGVQEFSLIQMGYNALTSLPERVWRPVLEKGINVAFSGNPLTCGCDVAWLVRNPQLLTGAQEAQCADGKFLADLDPADFTTCD